MWIFTRYGFYSIACGDNPEGSLDPGIIMIRARRAEHLKNLQGRFVVLRDAPINELVGTDYQYRLIVPKDVWLGVLTELGQEQEWSNFKSEAARHQGAAGADYVSALHRVWSLMARL